MFLAVAQMVTLLVTGSRAFVLPMQPQLAWCFKKKNLLLR